MKDYWIGSALAGVGLVTLTALTIAPRQDAAQLALVFPPWMSQKAVLAQIADLDIRLVRPGWGDSIVVVDVSEDPSLRAILGERALFLADPVVLGACFAKFT